MEKRKVIILVIVLAIVALLVSGGTYAFWKWTSSVNKNVIFNTIGDVEEYVVYDSGNSYFVGNFQPTATFCESTSTTVSFYKEDAIASVGLLATIKMDINSIGSNIAASNDVYWVVTEGDSSIDCSSGLTSSSVLSYGTFNGAVAGGDPLTLLEGVSVPLGVQVGDVIEGQEYTVWIWIDSTGTDLSSLSGDTIDTNVWTEITMYESASVYQEDILNGAGPVLDDGMVPIVLSADGVATTVDPTSSSWYSYENKQWANVVLVNEKASGTTGSHDRSYYLNNPGTTVLESDILAYYVWIPRYRYAFNKADGNPEEIDIVFESAETTKTIGTAIGKSYYTHPAFAFGDTELNGIWVGKFETSHSSLSLAASSSDANNLACTETSCENAFGLVIKPNVQSLRRNNVSNMFYASRLMSASGNPYGLDATKTDTHMLKNSEWGAVAYLSHSIYGLGEEIYINNSSGFYTGRSGGAVGGTGSTAIGGSYTWIGQPVTDTTTYGTVTDATLGTNASTTGNVTGVYDMSGGSWEYVMGNYAQTTGSSGFTTLPDSKYYDLYSSTQFTGDYETNMDLCTLETCGGHALHETAGWYSDYADFVGADYPWFERGGVCNGGSYAGAFYSGSDSNGSAGTYNSWRLVVVAGETGV